ncbi:CBS domain-containing membrane protein [Pararhizobium capsulatum DSM 1112]|uniref:CBS domain-containing membrane protein n=1 Tax=Pararhizobium capsulatum DSM 1112 TaxID=1121113 RepID=A0ABU0BMH5_9HYPH|nr:HPP family protein [Pararhizobium capsulatum]MDQ0318939.1 CBS domain-containing membrane protein [Pararhizobium capsulatum DSM 1112]
MHAILKKFVPEAPAISITERVRTGVGALAGIGITGLLALMFVGEGSTIPALIAPMGASAVLLFAVPSSPLAQPWPVVGGNLIAALTGVTIALLLPNVFLASAVAIGVAIALMMTLRCLHPPSGAIALTAVLGGPAIRELGYGYVLWPVAGNTIILLLIALLYNNLTGRPYPHALRHTAADHKTSDPPVAERVGFTTEDLDSVLAEYDEVIDIDRDDLAEILHRTELRSLSRRAGTTLCRHVMSRDVIAVSPDASLRHALELLQLHHIKALPVTNDHAQVIGIVTQTDILDKATWKNGLPTIGFRQRIRLSLKWGQAPSGIVRDIMTTPVRTVSPEATISEAIVGLAGEGLHYLPVTVADNKLVGIISQSDVMMAMLADRAAVGGEPSAETLPPL